MSRWVLSIVMHMTMQGYVMAATPALSLSELHRLEVQVRTVINERDPQKAIALFSSQFGMTEFARLCLVDYWDGLSIFQQQQYTGLFAKLIQANFKNKFLTISRSHHRYRQTFQSIRSVEDNTWVATARFVSSEYSGSVEYVLQVNQGKIELIDYVLGGVSLSRNYRGHFNHVMRTRGFAGLLADLNNKLRELR